MAERSLPWDGEVTGDCGPYGADDWQLLYQQIFNDQDSVSSRGPIWTDFQDSLVCSEYSTPNMSVDVDPGAALVDGCAYWNDTTKNLAIAAADPTLNRIDRVILRMDDPDQEVRLAVKTGTPSASPTPPTLQTDRSPYFEIPLFQVYVAATVTAIYDADITDERDWVRLGAVSNYDLVQMKGVNASISTDDTWTVMDGTNLKIDLTTKGGDVEVFLSTPLQYQNSSGTGTISFSLDVEVDGTRWGNGLTTSLGPYSVSIDRVDLDGKICHGTFTVTVTGLSAGSHTFKAMWKLNLYGTGSGTLSTAGTLTIQCFRCKEL